MSWRLAGSLVRLRDQLNVAYPNRNKASDGTIGDAAHQASASDHNPNAAGVVTALDITHDPANGVNTFTIADALIASPHPDLKYVISNRRIAGGWTGWAWQAYGGGDPHTNHMHVSVGQGDDGRSTPPYDDMNDWPIQGSATAPAVSGKIATVTVDTLYVRSSPNRSASLAGSQVLQQGNTFQYVDVVAGESVDGNGNWVKSAKGNYVWAGGTDVTTQVVPVAPPVPMYTVVETYPEGKWIKLNKQPTNKWGMNYEFAFMVDHPVETHGLGEVKQVFDRVHHKDGFDYFREQGQVDGFNVFDCDDYTPLTVAQEPPVIQSAGPAMTSVTPVKPAVENSWKKTYTNKAGKYVSIESKILSLLAGTGDEQLTLPANVPLTIGGTFSKNGVEYARTEKAMKNDWFYDMRLDNLRLVELVKVENDHSLIDDLNLDELGEHVEKVLPVVENAVAQTISKVKTNKSFRDKLVLLVAKIINRVKKHK